MDTALLKDIVLASHGEKYNFTFYHLKAFFHGEKSVMGLSCFLQEFLGTSWVISLDKDEKLNCTDIS